MTEQEPPDSSDLWKPAATTLKRVVPVAQKRKASGLTVTLSYLEIHEEGNGFLRFLMRQDFPTRWRALTMPRVGVNVQDGSGRPLETQEDGSGSSMQSSYASLEANASLLIFGLPDSGEIEVEVMRIANVKMDSPLLYFRMRPERVLRRRSGDGQLREEGSFSRLSRRLLGEEGPSWKGPWNFRFHV